jgi:hypothetical protein
VSLVDRADRMLMDSKQPTHSLGPWRVAQYGGSRAGHRVVAPSVEIEAGLGRSGAIARIYIRANGDDASKVMANAKLIAAAPDLAERVAASNWRLSNLLALIPLDRPERAQIEQDMEANRAALAKAGQS